VYTGRQALDLGLVDKLGGLDDAIKFAAAEAGLGEYDIRVIPEPLNFFDLLMGNMDRDDEFSRAAAGRSPFLTTIPVVQSMLPALARVDPMRARAIVRALEGLELMHAEGAVLMMPQLLLIR
jgi:protease-4